MADNKTLTIALGIGIVLALGFSGFTYLNMNTQLQQVKASLEDTEKERDKLEQETEKLQEDIEEKQEQIEDLEDQLHGSGKKIEDLLGKYEEVRQESQTLGDCLEGVIEAVAADDPAEAVFYLGSVATTCKKAGEIIENLNAPVPQPNVTNINF
ncbi:MAG: hypothetical protein GDA44_06065 [Prochloron sp. SP5CPC1]|nr:hypothetical protein [Candidatus Paraprochloron terpiosi SP5CPC1]